MQTTVLSSKGQVIIPKTLRVARRWGPGTQLEVHDTQNEKTGCELEKIKVEHRKWYDSLASAKADRSYDNCYWCLGASTR